MRIKAKKKGVLGVRYFICDDENIFAEDLARKILALRPNSRIETFSSLSSLEFALEDAKELHAVFLDIVNADGNGIEFAETLRKINPSVKLVFVTSYANEYNQEIFRCPPGREPIAFLAKPVEEAYLRNALEKIEAGLEEKSDFIHITKSRHSEYIKCDSIIYVASDKRQLRLISENEEYICYGNMGDILGKLPHYFCQCHRSYIINLKRIRRVISADEIEMSDGSSIPVGRSYHRQVKEAIASEYTKGRP